MSTTLPLPTTSGGGDGGAMNMNMNMMSSSTTFLHQMAPTNVTTTTAHPASLFVDGSDEVLMTSAEAKAVAACKSHKEAERLRRKRINAHLSTLRTLLPNLLKTDKASLLGEVVRRVRELKQATSQITVSQEGEGARLLPDETDVVRLRRCEGNVGVVIATLSCEDRPELLADLSRALKSVKAKVIKAEIATVGGRTKSVLWLQDGVVGAREGIGALSRALKVVVDRPNCAAYGPALGLFGAKRQRIHR